MRGVDAHLAVVGAAPSGRPMRAACPGRGQGPAPTFKRGFTLVELLVAIAIFVTVMASVALVFNGAIRTSKQGFQNQEAYELARGAMKVIERDLNRAFTNRNRGDVFNFYGTPIGFTYVGLIAANESSAPNMARVTYVIYHDPTFANMNAAYDEYTYDSHDGAEVPTYQLIRFVEPGADTLDSFPVPWEVGIDTDTGQITLQQIVDERVAAANCPDEACEELVEQAAKREIWIKMLAGGQEPDPNDPVSPRVPNAWTELPFFYDRPDPLNPGDYVVGENIRFLSLDDAPVCRADIETLHEDLEEQGRPIDFDDIEFTDGTSACVRFVNASIDAPVLYDTDNLQFSRAIFSTADGPRPFFTYWDIGVRENRQFIDPNTGNLVEDLDNINTADDQVRQIAFQFWNDWRNMVADGLDNDKDGTIDEADEQYADAAGSPLDTRLPIAVTIDFTLFFRSPYPGAPDFNERFTQRIDLPTAYRRTFDQRLTDQTQ